MKVSELKTEMDAQFDHVKEQFRDVDRRFEAIDRRFEAVDRRFEAVDRQFADVRSEMKAGFAEARRHTDVVAEDLRGQIATVLEVVVQTNKTVERMASEQQTLVAALGDHEVRIQALERRRR